MQKPYSPLPGLPGAAPSKDLSTLLPGLGAPKPTAPTVPDTTLDGIRKNDPELIKPATRAAVAVHIEKLSLKTTPIEGAQELFRALQVADSPYMMMKDFLIPPHTSDSNSARRITIHNLTIDRIEATAPTQENVREHTGLVEYLLRQRYLDRTIEKSAYARAKALYRSFNDLEPTPHTLAAAGQLVATCDKEHAGETADDLDRYLAKFDNHVKIQEAKLDLLMECGREAEAYPYAVAVLEARPDWTYQNGQLAASKQAYDAAQAAAQEAAKAQEAEAREKRQKEITINKYHKALQEGNRKDIIAAGEKYLEIDPYDHNVHFELGMAYRDDSQKDKAKEHARIAFNLRHAGKLDQPQSFDKRYALLYMRMLMQQPTESSLEEARLWIDMCTKAMPYDPFYTYMEGLHRIARASDPKIERTNTAERNILRRSGTNLLGGLIMMANEKSISAEEQRLNRAIVSDFVNAAYTDIDAMMARMRKTPDAIGADRMRKNIAQIAQSTREARRKFPEVLHGPARTRLNHRAAKILLAHMETDPRTTPLSRREILQDIYDFMKPSVEVHCANATDGSSMHLLHHTTFSKISGELYSESDPLYEKLVEAMPYREALLDAHKEGVNIRLKGSTSAAHPVRPQQPAAHKPRPQRRPI